MHCEPSMICLLYVLLFVFPLDIASFYAMKKHTVRCLWDGYSRGDFCQNEKTNIADKVPVANSNKRRISANRKSMSNLKNPFYKQIVIKVKAQERISLLESVSSYYRLKGGGRRKAKVPRGRRRLQQITNSSIGLISLWFLYKDQTNLI